MTSETELVAVGQITRTQGNAGAVRMVPLFEPVDRFDHLRGDTLILRMPRRTADELALSTPPGMAGDLAVVHVARHSFHQQCVILALAEIPDMTAAEKLRGAEVLVAPEDLWSLEQDEFFHWQLIGCGVFDDRTDDPLGTVDRVDAGSAHDFLRVKRPDGSAFLVPMIMHMVTSVDVAARRIRVDLPPGLADL